MQVYVDMLMRFEWESLGVGVFRWGCDVLGGVGGCLSEFWKNTLRLHFE